MVRSFAWLATLLPAIALLLLVVQWSVSGALQTSPLQAWHEVSMPPLDPAQALLEIDELRSQRGSILANSSLELVSENIPAAFMDDESSESGNLRRVAAVANVAAEHEFVKQLRKTARLLDEQANAKEDASDYEAETALRNLANQLRLTAKAVHP